jgi:hypothetical protein
LSSPADVRELIPQLKAAGAEGIYGWGNALPASHTSELLNE